MSAPFAKFTYPTGVNSAAAPPAAQEVSATDLDAQPRDDTVFSSMSRKNTDLGHEEASTTHRTRVVTLTAAQAADPGYPNVFHTITAVQTVVLSYCYRDDEALEIHPAQPALFPEVAAALDAEMHDGSRGSQPAPVQPAPGHPVPFAPPTSVPDISTNLAVAERRFSAVESIFNRLKMKKAGQSAAAYAAERAIIRATENATALAAAAALAEINAARAAALAAEEAANLAEAQEVSRILSASRASASRAFALGHASATQALAAATSTPGAGPSTQRASPQLEIIKEYIIIPDDDSAPYRQYEVLITDTDDDDRWPSYPKGPATT